MKIIKPFLILFTLTLFYSCDPKTYGTIYLKNHSDEKINIQYKGRLVNIDTIIQVNSKETVKLLFIDHWGNPKKFECCPCEFDSLAISTIDTTIQITKDINDKGNWTQDNSNLKMWKNHQVDCYFELNKSDIK